ncbi:hypothetical protein AAGR22_13975 [Erwinia sp. HDF1-3R]|uniref:hypothetical protein n=1 Tax=Erwinia sp. HDF1-3R TaxID=3141543 RepID=UPI0031F4F3EF
MKIPRYLVIALALTGASLLVSEFLFPEQDVIQPAQPLTPRQAVKSAGTPTARLTAQEGFSDLFPVPERLQVKPALRDSVPVPERPAAPQFPFNVAGGWWKGGQRIIIITDGTVDRLLCRECSTEGAVRPGKAITPEWQLNEIAADHLTVEWLPQKLLERIELGDLKSEPTR